MATYSSTVQLNYNIIGSGQPGASDGDTFNESNANCPGTIQRRFPFSTGDNVITPPTGATQLILTNVSGTVKLCSGAGVAGYSLGATYTSKIPITGATICLNASAGALGDLVWI